MVIPYDRMTAGNGTGRAGGAAVQTSYGATYLADGRKFGKRAKPGEIDYPRLFQAMRTARRILQPYRDERLNIIRQMVGSHYSEGGSDQKVPVNLVYKYMQIVSRSLVPNCPRVMLSTRRRDAQPSVSSMQEWVNQRLVAGHFEKKIERFVLDALTSVAVMKVALASPADSAMMGYTAPAGIPFCEVVDLDDFVFDVGARTFEQASYVGHRYRIPLEIAMSLDYFDKKVRESLPGAASPDDYRINQEGDDRVGTIGTGWQGGEVRDFEEMVDLWEIYVPRLKRVITFASSSGGVPDESAEPLRSVEWVGPDCGPYHFLEMMPVPGNPMPSAPLHHLIDIHSFVNHGYRKLVNQMQRQKEVLPVRGGQLDDGKNLIQANDGEAFGCDNADQIRPVSYGGPNQVNANFTVHLSDVFNRLAGNLDLIGGTAPQSKTASQDKLLNENASAGISDMQQKTTLAVSKICEAYCWYWWYHPQEVMRTSKSLPGLPDIATDRKLYPGTYQEAPGEGGVLKREGKFEDLFVRVDPYSMVFRTPQQRLQFLLTMFDKFAPVIALFSAQGVQMDVQFLIKKIAEYADEPDITGLFTISEPQPLAAGPGGDGGGPGKPSETTRNYTRQSVGQDTEASRLGDMQRDADHAQGLEKHAWGTQQ